jgi:hypothetical protein
VTVGDDAAATRTPAPSFRPELVEVADSPVPDEQDNGMAPERPPGVRRTRPLRAT